MRGVPRQRDVTNLEQPNFTEGSHGASKRLNPALAGWQQEAPVMQHHVHEKQAYIYS